ncbi:lytic murein transglycosylase [Aestuariivita boseongensis]|uniref:lytic murein transglycosylase n=1 Tax=Aestuariivita boseongensis TaxID=1470562 RepID=UPI0006807E01|nr:lytic murein transglycosylase [Aestuariivita boseongensis]
MRVKILGYAVALVLMAQQAAALTCSNTSAGFDAWKSDFATYAKQQGVGQRGLQALAGSRYSQATINADRNQKGVRYALNDFIRIRLGSLDGFAAMARKRKTRNPEFYAALERIYGVPAGVLLAIHGMETGFGRNMGNIPIVSSAMTLTFDCRRSDFFRPHAIAALKFVDAGVLSLDTRGAAHAEMGHTQFLPGNALIYGVDANGDGRVDFFNEADALASTANFLRQKGWKPGRGYQQGEPNFAVIKEWNAATVYQQAIALAGERIDR